MNPDERDIPGPLSGFSGKYLNLFPDLVTPRSGRLKNVTYYAAREGTFYISFWKPLGNHMFELMTKLAITSERHGLQGSEPEGHSVEEGNALAIHYNNDSTQGVVYYERSDHPNRNLDIPLYPVYKLNWQDDGWLNGTVLNLAGTLISATKNVALHITICDVNECETKPEVCLHGGRCENTDGDFQCHCTDQWTGRICAEDVNECETKPGVCLNGRRCENTDGAFLCHCTDQWTDPTCAEDVNECETKPEVCLHGGRCENTDGDFQCHCTDQWTGAICAEDVNECETTTEVCIHGGRCENTNGAFLCHCTAQWTGPTCAEDKEVKDSSKLGLFVALVVVWLIALVLTVSITALAIILHRTRQSTDKGSAEEVPRQDIGLGNIVVSTQDGVEQCTDASMMSAYETIKGVSHTPESNYETLRIH